MKSYTASELLTFIESETFDQLKNIPISKHRAISQSNNPRLEDGDKILFVAYEGDKTVGYLGILPDIVYRGEEKCKVGWLSCFWIDQSYQGKSIAAGLFLRVIRRWRKKILITNIVPTLEPVYQNVSIFRPTTYKAGFRGYLRMSLATILPPKKSIFRQAVPLIRLIDYAFNFFHDIRLGILKKRVSKSLTLTYAYLSHIDKETERFFEQQQQDESIKRGKSELEWILFHPWILVGVDGDYDADRYYFSSVDRQFFYQCVKFKNDQGEMVGFCMLSVRNEHLTIPYCYILPSYVDELRHFIIGTLLHFNLSTFTVFHPLLVQAFKASSAPFFHSRSIQRPYLISKDIFELDKDSFQDGDGDSIFT